MFYLGIDQHSKQLTISLCNETGDVVQRRQVSTEPARVADFFRELSVLAEPHGGFMAIVEVCGFNDWLINLLQRSGCRDVVLIHPEHRSRRKTDRRDARALCDLLWVNRQRWAEGERSRGLRRVVIPTRLEQQLRELTSHRQRLGRLRTRTLNQLQGLLRRHNLQWESPTKLFQTNAVKRWLRELCDTSRLTRLEQLHVSHWMAQWELYDLHIEELNETIARYGRYHAATRLLRSVPGMGAYSALALAARIGDIRRFWTPRSLGNYFGLTPGCRNSGETTDRLGSITKDGSRLARFILGQLVLHVLKADSKLRDWYRGIKRRRGSKIARVAVMRRLTTILWHLLTHNQPYGINHQPELEIPVPTK
jgi:transposase